MYHYSITRIQTYNYTAIEHVEFGLDSKPFNKQIAIDYIKRGRACSTTGSSFGCKILTKMMRADSASGLGKTEPLKHNLSGYGQSVFLKKID
jgi:hypothetical protein